MSSAAKDRLGEKPLAQSLADGVTALAKHLRNVKLPDGMSRERLVTLKAIEERGALSMTELAAIARVKVSTMSRMVASLAADGLVKRKTVKTDGRGVVLSLTAKGRRASAKANEHTVRYLTDALGQLSGPQVSALTALAAKLDSLASDDDDAA